MNHVISDWWVAVSGYFTDAASVLTGHVQLLPLGAALGLVCLVAGVLWLVLGRIRHAMRVIWLLAAAILAPVAITLSNSILGWLGMLFAVLAGAIFLVVGTTVIANGADRRVPVWLIGVFSALFAYYCATVGGAFLALTQ